MNCFLRLLFSATLILTSIKGLQEINENKGFVSQNIRLISEKIPMMNKLNNLRKYSGLILSIENDLLILSACFLIFGTKLAKITGLLAVLIEIILVHNPIFYGENIYRGISSQYLAILGGILSF